MNNKGKLSDTKQNVVHITEECQMAKEIFLILEKDVNVSFLGELFALCLVMRECG